MLSGGGEAAVNITDLSVMLRSLFFLKKKITTASFQFSCLFTKMQKAESCQHFKFSQGFCGKWDFNYAFIKKEINKWKKLLNLQTCTFNDVL